MLLNVKDLFASKIMFYRVISYLFSISMQMYRSLTFISKIRKSHGAYSQKNAQKCVMSFWMPHTTLFVYEEKHSKKNCNWLPNSNNREGCIL